ncbi:MAG: GerAB/ArcD/ProY family transporter [Bacilli bacterium]
MTSSYLLSRSLVLGIVYSKLFALVGQNAIIAGVLGMLLGIFFVYIFSKIKLNNKTKFFELVLYIIFIEIAFIILTNFVSSFFLIRTPKIVITLPTLLLCIYASTKKTKVLKNLSPILTFLSLLMIIFSFLTLLKYLEISNILPLFNFENKKMIQAVFLYAVITTSPLILLNDEENIKSKEYIISYLFSNIITLLVLFFTIGVLGQNLIKIYSFPEYMILKKISIGSFIENVENIVSSAWYFELFFIIVLSIKKIINIVKKKSICYFIVITIAIINSFIINDNFSTTLIVYNNFYYVIFIILFIIILLSDKKKS